jgi:hypothetical protein
MTRAVPAKPDENAMPGLAPAVPPWLDPVELVVDGERFVVTRGADSPGTYHFDWISHPESYGFTIGTNFGWRPDRAELTQQIRDFLWPRSTPRPATCPTNPQADRLAGRRLASPSAYDEALVKLLR